MDKVRLEIDEGVATVTIDAPASRNVLSPPVVADLESALSAAEDADCLVVRGAGDTFCAGGALDGVVAQATGDLPVSALLDRLERIDGLIERLYSYPLPTVAAVEGPAFATGAALTLACDLTVASEAGRIGFGFGRIGLAPAGGSSHLLPRTVGPATARYLLFSGALLDAERATELGLFDRRYPAAALEDHLAALLDRIADGATGPLAAAKTVLVDDRSELRAAMASERATQRRLVGTDEHRECVAAFLAGDDHAHRD